MYLMYQFDPLFVPGFIAGIFMENSIHNGIV